MKKPWKVTAIMALVYLSLGFAEWGEPTKFIMNTALFAGAVAVVWLVYWFKSRGQE